VRKQHLSLTAAELLTPVGERRNTAQGAKDKTLKNAALPAARVLVYFCSELLTERAGVQMQLKAASVPSAGDRSNKAP